MYENNTVCQREVKNYTKRKLYRKIGYLPEINQQTILTLVDTGADISLIRDDVARTMKLKWKRGPGDFATFCTANEGVMENLRTTACDIKIDGLGLGAKLNVVSKLTNPLIPGIDFLRDNGGHVNIPEGIVEFYDYKVQVSIIPGKLRPLTLNVWATW